MTEPETPMPAVAPTADDPFAITSVTVVNNAPRAEDVVKPSAPPPPVIQVSKDNLIELISAKQQIVQSAAETRDRAKLDLEHLQTEYEHHANELQSLQTLAKLDGKIVLTVIG